VIAVWQTDQLRGDPKLVALPPDASFEYRRDVQVLPILRTSTFCP